MKSIFITFCMLFLKTASSVAQQPETALEPYLVKSNGHTAVMNVSEVEVPGYPPALFRMPVATITATAVMLDSVPAYNWSFGCSNTAAAMAAGYYDLNGYPEIYTAITNDGQAPMDNILWGTIIINGEVRSQCPLSATRMGLDERISRGHVDDFWVRYRHYGPDPFIQNGWNRHEDEDCTGDFMGSNQSAFGNSDGNTRFFFVPDGSPLHDYTGNEPLRRDGCHGLRLFFESRGYQVIENYTQLLQGYYGNNLGFTFEQYMEEIDNQRPVLLQLNGHTMLGLGYDSSTAQVYLHDTWDHALHSMVWEGTYAGLNLWGVTVLRLHAVNPPPMSGFSMDSDSICAGQSVKFTDTSLFQPASWLWSFPGGIPAISAEQHPKVTYPVPGIYPVSLRSFNEFGYDTETRHHCVFVDEPCYCRPAGNTTTWITGVQFGNISFSNTGCSETGYSEVTSPGSGYLLRTGQPLMVRAAGDSASLQCVKAWIDWNGNMDFEDTGEEYILQNPYPGLFTAMITPPPDYCMDRTRLRIATGRMDMGACGRGEAGEIEDYLLDCLSSGESNQLIINVLIDGLLAQTRTMNACHAGSNIVFPAPVADLLQVSLVDTCSPHPLICLSRNLPLSNEGVCKLVYPDSLVGNRYYLVLNHRNSLETWSAEPVLLMQDSTVYDFTASRTSAFGENLAGREERFAVYSGDINQDGLIDLDDMILVSAILSTPSAYQPEDLNGDGMTDQLDLVIVVEGASAFISLKRPD